MRLHELRDNRDTCRFCELLYKAIERYSNENTSDETACSLTWEVDGRRVEPDSGNCYVNSTRRIRLSWCETTGNGQEVYLVFVAPRDPQRPNSDARATWKQEMYFLGREFGDQREKQALIKSWLDLCVNNHNEACLDTHGTGTEFIELIKETYFGVIDVADMQLKALPITKGKPERYVALSYVWGRRSHDESPYTTTRANVLTHILHGGLETAVDKLPRTIQDAILLVSRLGERYLWIDSLCIVQDSDSSWQLNARAMHLVYGNAYFTICAADGDSSTGLCAVKPVLRATSLMDPLSDGVASMSLDGTQTSEDVYSLRPMSAECAPGVRLMVTRPLEAVVNDSMWNKRAWTFQERILSRRCLIFAEDRVYFQCRSTGISQDIYTDGKGQGWSLDRTNSPLRTLRDLQQRPLWFYMKYVGMYTSRNLTKPGDILAAFEGISWLLERYMHAPSLFGIPTSHFDLALLWAPLDALRRRRPSLVASLNSKNTCSQDDNGNCMCHFESESFGGKEFPSWSWCGWMGATMEYQFGMIEGCLLNVREWLKYHTWIQWHIRDEKGHIRPLCEISSRSSIGRVAYSYGPYQPSSRSGSSDGEDRWKGYPGVGVVQRGSHAGDGSDERRRGRSPIRRENGPRHTTSPSSPEPSQPPAPDWAARTKEPSHKPLPYPVSPPGRDKDLERVGTTDYIQESASPQVHRGDYSYGYDYDPSDESGSDSRAESDINIKRVDNSYYLKNRSLERRKKPNSRMPSRPSQSPYEDKYGRLIRAEIPKSSRSFHAILPDNPFGVIREKYYSQDPSDLQYRPILQFWTWRTELHIVTRESYADTTTKSSVSGLCQCDVVDKEGDWCGSIVLSKEWILERQGSLFQLIAISDAKAFTQEECPVWTYYIPKEREESEWDLYYTLLLERNTERGVWERAGLGKVFQAAFREKTWDEIKLG